MSLYWRVLLLIWIGVLAVGAVHLPAAQLVVWLTGVHEISADEKAKTQLLLALLFVFGFSAAYTMAVGFGVAACFSKLQKIIVPVFGLFSGPRIFLFTVSPFIVYLGGLEINDTPPFSGLRIGLLGSFYALGFIIGILLYTRKFKRS